MAKAKNALQMIGNLLEYKEKMNAEKRKLAQEIQKYKAQQGFNDQLQRGRQAERARYGLENEPIDASRREWKPVPKTKTVPRKALLGEGSEETTEQAEPDEEMLYMWNKKLQKFVPQLDMVRPIKKGKTTKQADEPLFK